MLLSSLRIHPLLQKPFIQLPVQDCLWLHQSCFLLDPPILKYSFHCVGQSLWDALLTVKASWRKWSPKAIKVFHLFYWFKLDQRSTMFAILLTPNTLSQKCIKPIVHRFLDLTSTHIAASQWVCSVKPLHKIYYFQFYCVNGPWFLRFHSTLKTIYIFSRRYNSSLNMQTCPQSHLTWLTSNQTRSLQERFFVDPSLQQDTGPLCGCWLRIQEDPDSLWEHVLNAVLAEGWALHVAKCLDVAGQGSALMVADRCLVLLLQLPLSLGVISEVTLRPNKQDWNARTMMRHLLGIMKFVNSVNSMMAINYM